MHLKKNGNNVIRRKLAKTWDARWAQLERGNKQKEWKQKAVIQELEWQLHERHSPSAAGEVSRYGFESTPEESRLFRCPC